MAGRDITTTHLAAASDDGSGRLGGDGRLPPLGAVIAGKYRIDGLLGRGGMGVVALGRQLELDRPVAIKFLREPLGSDVRPLQRFMREARIIARMRSEHVVRVFDVGREHAMPFIVMERLSGHDLSKEIELGPLGVERAVEFALHACEALGEAHSLGIVHRDVKPSNLFVAEGFGGREQLKVLDFGVSKWLARAHDVDTPALSTDGGAVGTPAFASPEQLTHPEHIDGRTDVWALGVVLYQALSGELPFAADTIPALYSRIIGGTATPFPPARAVPAELVDVLERCLRRAPSERYASMLELARSLVPFAPARAHAVVDSLATLAAREDIAEVVAAAEKVESQLSTTLEFSQATPPARAEKDVKSRPRRGLVVAFGLAAVAGVVALVAAWPRASERGAPSAAVHAPEDASAEAPRVAVTAAANQVATANAVNEGRTATNGVAADGGVNNGNVAMPSGSALTSPGVHSAAAPRLEPLSKRAASATRTTSAAPVPSVAPALSASATHPSDTVPLYRH